MRFIQTLENGPFLYISSGLGLNKFTSCRYPADQLCSQTRSKGPVFDAFRAVSGPKILDPLDNNSALIQAGDSGRSRDYRKDRTRLHS